jgi:hypothetical protein
MTINGCMVVTDIVTHGTTLKLKLEAVFLDYVRVHPASLVLNPI